MNKMFKENCFFSDEGEAVVQPLHNALLDIFSSEEVKEMSETELRVLGANLAKIVGERVSNVIQHKTNEINKFAAMTDEGFQKYLDDKYTPLYGKNWQIKISITDEEGDRCVQTFRKQMLQDKEDLKNRPREQNYGGLRLSPRQKTRFRSPGAYNAAMGAVYPDKYKK